MIKCIENVSDIVYLDMSDIVYLDMVLLVYSQA